MSSHGSHKGHENKGASREDLMYYEIPLHLRDNCSGILIPLNKCRQDNMYLPWKCEHERHSYEVCLYEEYERRRAIKNATKK